MGLVLRSALITSAAAALEMVARHGSIRQAAERMNITPSAVNRQILNLESEYGLLLFDRLPRGMRPTEAGRQLISLVRRWQLEAREADAALDQLRSHYDVNIQLGLMECLTPSFLPLWVRRLRELHPNAVVNIQIGGTDWLVEQVKKGAVDIAVAFNTPRDSELSILHTSVLPLGIVVSSRHRLAHLKTVAFSEIEDELFVMPDPSLTLAARVDGMVERAHASPRKLARANSIMAIKKLVQENLGISFLTEIDAYEEINSGALRFIPLEGARSTTVLSLSCRDSSAFNAVGHTLSEIIIADLKVLESG